MKRCPPCHGDCDEGRMCDASTEATRALLSRLTLNQREGGHSVNGRLTFPLTVDRDERMPQRYRLQPQQRLAGVLYLRFALIVLVVALAAAAQVFIA